MQKKSSLKILGITAALLMAGCTSLAPQSSAPQTPPPIGASTAPVGDICNTQAAQWAVGQMPTAKVTEDARVRSGSRMARVLRPGQMVTKELDRQRLNLELDAGGKIIAARCG